MRPGLRLGRIGPLTINLHYTWIFAAILVLWWVALQWLPENFPSWAPNFYWLVAVAVVLLYVVCVILHEAVHAVIARTAPHHVTLFPFGVATPFQIHDMTLVRAITAALAAPLFNLILGVIMMLVGEALMSPGNMLAWLAAVLVPLGWINIWVGLINLIPGTPFDGGMALSAGVYFFTNDREAALSLAQSIGRVVTLVLVLAGAWRGLTSHLWLQALALVVAGWAANEAATAGRERRALRELFSQLKAADLMESSRADDVVDESQTIVELVKAHPRFPPNTPLAVVDSQGTLSGITTLAATDTLLQGNWPTTPVRSITTPVNALDSVTPNTPLVTVLAVAQKHMANADVPPDEVPNIAVVENKKLVGSINPTRLQLFEDTGRQFGIEETLGPLAGEKSAGWVGRLASLIPVVLVLAVMAILGNLALNTDPVDLQEPPAIPEAVITFNNFRPADGDIIGLGAQVISVQIASNSAIVSGTITLDGNILDTTLSGTSPVTQTATANTPGLTLGAHTARINAVTESGDRKSSQWRFNVDSRALAPTPTPAAGAEPTPSPPAQGALDTTRMRPAQDGLVQAGTGEVAVSVDITDTQAPTAATITLDGNKLDTKVAPVSGVDNRFRVSATSSAVAAGKHTVRLDVTRAGAGTHSSQWTFSAIVPDADHAYFKETGYFVSQPFLKYWQEKGGLGLFGYPISDPVQETDQSTGEIYTAQYFERARFEQHPSLGDQVVLGRLGALLQQPEPPAQPRDGYTFFPETGHNVSSAFLKYWNETGGLAVFGYPITEERTEKNAIDGKEYTVQYFERNRLELHPEQAGTPFEVQLGLLGTQLYKQLYGE
jgi:Zn-dependent protease